MQFALHDGHRCSLRLPPFGVGFYAGVRETTTRSVYVAFLRPHRDRASQPVCGAQQQSLRPFGRRHCGCSCFPSRLHPLPDLYTGRVLRLSLHIRNERKTRLRSTQTSSRSGGQGRSPGPFASLLLHGPVILLPLSQQPPITGSASHRPRRTFRFLPADLMQPRDSVASRNRAIQCRPSQTPHLTLSST